MAAFLVSTYPTLQRDPAVDALERIISILQTDLTDAPGSWKPSPTAVQVNSLWFASLVLSISTAFIAVMAKEWLLNLDRDLSPLLHTRGRQHQYRHDCREKWMFTTVLTSLPILLHISLLLFLAGLVVFLWDIHKKVAIVSAALVSVTVLIYCTIHLLSLSSPTCPYRTSATTVMRACMRSFVIVVTVELARLLNTIMKISLDVRRHRFRCGTSRSQHSMQDTLDSTDREIRRERLVTEIKQIVSLSFSAKADLMPGSWEEENILNEQDRVDARALARTIINSPQFNSHSTMTEDEKDMYERLAQDITYLDTRALLDHRDHFIRAGSVQLLLSQFDSSQVSRIADTLATLLTEAGSSPVDISSVIQVRGGVPVHCESPDLCRIIMESPTRCQEIIQSRPFTQLDQITDLALYANLLRIELKYSSLILLGVDGGSQAWRYGTTWNHVAELHRRIKSGGRKDSGIQELSQKELLTLVNTLIYASILPVKWISKTRRLTIARSVDLDGEGQKFAVSTLQVLATLMRHRPDMGYAIKRQICWVIWCLSLTEPKSSYGTLVPYVTSVSALIQPVVNLLTLHPPPAPQRSHLHLVHHNLWFSTSYITLLLLDSFLHHPQTMRIPTKSKTLLHHLQRLYDSREEPQETWSPDAVKLCRELVHRFHAFTTHLAWVLQSGSRLSMEARRADDQSLLWVLHPNPDSKAPPPPLELDPSDLLMVIKCVTRITSHLARVIPGPSLYAVAVDKDHLLLRTLAMISTIASRINAKTLTDRDTLPTDHAHMATNIATIDSGIPLSDTPSPSRAFPPRNEAKEDFLVATIRFAYGAACKLVISQFQDHNPSPDSESIDRDDHTAKQLANLFTLALRHSVSTLR